MNMIRRIAVLLVVSGLSVVPAHAQLVVIDPGNLVEVILIARRTLQEYNKLVEQYDTIRRMAGRLGPMDRYRIPGIAMVGHDPSRWSYGTPWLEALVRGDPAGRLYEQTA